MPHPRSTTVLVEGIPTELRTSMALEKYFTDIFGEDTIESVHMVLNTKELKHLRSNLKDTERLCQDAMNQWDKDGVRPRSMHPETLDEVDTIDYYKELVKQSALAVEVKRQEILDAKGQLGNK